MLPSTPFETGHYSKPSELHDQTQYLSGWALSRATAVLGFGSLVSGMDQTAITTLIPTISRDLNARETTIWVGVCFCIGATVMATISGRLSDLFGRKVIYCSTLAVLCLADFACGFARNITAMLALRTLTGMAGGTISTLTNAMMSDYAPPDQRGAKQGILGTMIAFGNALGPILGSLLAMHSSWRKFFKIIMATLALLATATTVPDRFLPSKMPPTNKERLRNSAKKVDGFGILLSTAVIVLGLVPLSLGGRTYAWNSLPIIAMFVGAAVCAILFCVAEWKAAYPMMPGRLFTNRTVVLILLNQILVGLCWQTAYYYMPLYFQNVRDYTPLTSSLYMLPLMASHALFSWLGGQYQSKYKRYQEIFIFGYAMWLVGCGLLQLCGPDVHLAVPAVCLALIGVGTGCTLALSTNALQANTHKDDKATVVSVRNFIRTAGSAIGLAAAATINSSAQTSALPSALDFLAEDTLARPSLSSFSAAEQEVIGNAYASAIKKVFIMLPVCMALCLISSCCMKDNGLQRETCDDGEKKEPQVLGQKETAAEDRRNDSKAGTVSVIELGETARAYLG